MKKIFLYSILFVVLVAVILIVWSQQKNPAEQACIQACQNALNQGTDLNNGPCLLNPITSDKDWVCDVAHDPRQSVDNLPENQCSAYRNGLANHFVEVNPNCQFIRAF